MNRLRLHLDTLDAPAPLPFPGLDGSDGGSDRGGTAGIWRRREPGRAAGAGRTRVPGRTAEDRSPGDRGAAVLGAGSAAEAALERAQAALDDLRGLTEEDERALTGPAPLPFRPFAFEIDPDDGPWAA